MFGKAKRNNSASGSRVRFDLPSSLKTPTSPSKNSNFEEDDAQPRRIQGAPVLSSSSHQTTATNGGAHDHTVFDVNLTSNGGQRGRRERPTNRSTVPFLSSSDFQQQALTMRSFGTGAPVGVVTPRSSVSSQSTSVGGGSGIGPISSATAKGRETQTLLANLQSSFPFVPTPPQQAPAPTLMSQPPASSHSSPTYPLFVRSNSTTSISSSNVGTSSRGISAGAWGSAPSYQRHSSAASMASITSVLAVTTTEELEQLEVRDRVRVKGARALDFKKSVVPAVAQLYEYEDMALRRDSTVLVNAHYFALRIDEMETRELAARTTLYQQFFYEQELLGESQFSVLESRIRKGLETEYSSWLRMISVFLDAPPSEQAIIEAICSGHLSERAAALIIDYHNRMGHLIPDNFKVNGDASNNNFWLMMLKQMEQSEKKLKAVPADHEKSDEYKKFQTLKSVTFQSNNKSKLHHEGYSDEFFDYYLNAYLKNKRPGPFKVSYTIDRKINNITPAFEQRVKERERHKYAIRMEEINRRLSELQTIPEYRSHSSARSSRDHSRSPSQTPRPPTTLDLSRTRSPSLSTIGAFFEKQRASRDGIQIPIRPNTAGQRRGLAISDARTGTAVDLDSFFAPSLPPNERKGWRPASAAARPTSAAATSKALGNEASLPIPSSGLLAFGAPVPHQTLSHQSEIDAHLRGVSRTSSMARSSRNTSPQTTSLQPGEGTADSHRHISPSAGRSVGGATNHSSGIHPFNGNGKHIQNPYFTTHFRDLGSSDTVARREVNLTTSPRSNSLRASNTGVGLMGGMVNPYGGPVESVPGTKQPIPPAISLGELGYPSGGLNGASWREQLLQRRRKSTDQEAEPHAAITSPGLSTSPISLEPSPAEPSHDSDQPYHYVVPSALFEHFIGQKQAYDKAAALRASDRARRRKAAEEAERRVRDAAKVAFLEWKARDEKRRGISPVGIDMEAEWLWSFNYHKALTTLRHRQLASMEGWLGPAISLVSLYAPRQMQPLLRAHKGLFTE